MTTAGERERPLMQCTSTLPPSPCTVAAGQAGRGGAGGAGTVRGELQGRVWRRTSAPAAAVPGNRRPQSPASQGVLLKLPLTGSAGAGAATRLLLPLLHAGCSRSLTQEEEALVQGGRRGGGGVVVEGVAVQRLAAGHRLQRAAGRKGSAGQGGAAAARETTAARQTAGVALQLRGCGAGRSIGRAPAGGSIGGGHACRRT